MSVKAHYEDHLARFYSWMAGDFERKSSAFESFLKENGIFSTTNQPAIDLGAGHGIQSVAMGNLGFKVTAIDFNDQLLNELKQNAGENSIEVVKADIRNVVQFRSIKTELIVCCGDTITHLGSKGEIEKLIVDCLDVLTPGGKMILSFRDYSQELLGVQRFIPVKSDENRILTCILEYHPEMVTVTDLLQEKSKEGWQQKVSSYQKVRISPQQVLEVLESNGAFVVFNDSIDRMQTLIAQKQNGF